MDQIKIGKFIAACRKEQGLTQAHLAELLNISDRAISKWENGKSMPDSSIMLSLCEILKINVNELLLGEHISIESYHHKSEDLLLDLKEENENYAKRLMKAAIYIIVIGIISGLIMINSALVIILQTGNDSTLVTALIILGCLVTIISSFVGLGMELKTGYYKCSKCGHIYKPTSFFKIAFALHINTIRYIKCPKCKKRSWQKKVLTKDEEIND